MWDTAGLVIGTPDEEPKTQHDPIHSICRRPIRRADPRTGRLDRGELSSHLVRLMDAAVDVIPELVLQALEPSYVML